MKDAALQWALAHWWLGVIVYAFLMAVYADVGAWRKRRSVQRDMEKVWDEWVR